MLKKRPIKSGLFIVLMVFADLLFLVVLGWWLWSMLAEMNYHKASPKIPASKIPEMNSKILDDLSK